ncbi:MAG: carbon-nitrogen hydrolase family protein [Proteobacteria bacterium]|nr:carbon-nitrogen hydrolase family protein [Pseudomonadota bacterium]
MKVAAWQYPIEAQASLAAWRAKLDAGIGEAAAAGAALCVVPEYAAMELTSLVPTATTLDAQVVAMQELLGDHDAAYRAAATRHRITVVAGSFPVRSDDGVVRNRLLVIGPRGDAIAVEKLQMTRFEHERWGISAGASQHVIELAGGVRLGVAICYDAEFPLIVRRLATAGANVIAVPSCTDSLAGYHRVRVACQARALENQCYVVQAPTVGLAPGSLAVDANVGAAGVFAPCDRGFPDDGVVALGTLGAAQLLVAELELAAIDAVRADGQVLGHRDWDAPNHLGATVMRRALAR